MAPSASKSRLRREFADVDALQAELDDNLRTGALFIPTDSPQARAGDAVQIELELPNAQTLELDATIVCRVPGGVAVQVVGFSEAMLQQLEAAAGTPVPVVDPKVDSAQSLLEELLGAAGNEVPAGASSAPDSSKANGAADSTDDDALGGRRRIPYRYQCIEDLQREYDLDLRYGRLFVTTDLRPPVGTSVDVVLLVPGADPYVVPTSVVFHASGGIGGRLIDFGDELQASLEAFAYGETEPVPDVPELPEAPEALEAPEVSLPEKGGVVAHDVYPAEVTDARARTAPEPPEPPAATPPKPAPPMPPPKRAAPEIRGDFLRADSVKPVEKTADGTRILRRRFSRIEDMRGEYATNVKSGGIFIPCAEPPALKERVRVSFELAGESRAVTLEGEIVFESPAGVGVQLQPLSLPQRITFEQMLGLDHESEPESAPKATQEEPEAEQIDPWSQGTLEVAPALRRTGDPSVRWADSPEDLTATKAPKPSLSAEPVANLRYRLGSLDELRQCYSEELCAGFLTLEVEVPPPQDSPVLLSLHLPAGGEIVVRGGIAAIEGARVRVELVDLADATARALEAALLGVPVGRIVDSGAGRVDIEPVAPEVPEAEAPAPEPEAVDEPFDVELVAVIDEGIESLDSDTHDGSASWARVLARLFKTQASGLLTVVGNDDPGTRKDFVVKKGFILDGRSLPPRADESLPAVIRRLKMLRGKALRTVTEAADSAMWAEQIDVIRQTGVLSDRDVERARQWQVVDACAEVMTWTQGNVRFDPRGEVGWSRGNAALPTEQIVTKGIREHARLSREELERALRPVWEQAPRRAEESLFDADRLGMDEDDRKFWSSLNGVHSCRKILTISPLGKISTLRMLYVLTRMGLVGYQESIAGHARPVDVLKERLDRFQSADAFACLGLSWQASPAQIDAALAEARKEYGERGRWRNADDPEVARICAELLDLIGEAHTELQDRAARRKLRERLVNDPDRIRATARMHAEQGKFLLFKGDVVAAVAAYEVALDLDPADAGIQEGLEKARMAAMNA